MLNLSLRPGQGLGPFVLGQCLPEVLVWLQQRKLEYRCVEIKFDSKNTLEQDILVCFPEHGFQLHFEPSSQRLRLVEIFDATRLQMVYGRTAVFGGASNAPTFGRIYQAFGPTYPGEPDAEGAGSYPLQYPGIMMLFPQLPSHCLGHASPMPGGPAAAYGGEGGIRGAPSFPVPLGVAAERIYIHAGTRGPMAAVLASPPPPLEPGTHYTEPLEAVPCHGLYLGPGCSTAVHFGDSPQDVVSQLGLPTRVVPKAGGASALSATAADYFYTYPSRGVDLLFCGISHRLFKVVLHTNVPGHPDFNAYCKANFRVHPCAWRPPQPLQQQTQLLPSEEELSGAEDGVAGSEGGYSAAEQLPAYIKDALQRDEAAVGVGGAAASQAAVGGDLRGEAAAGVLGQEGWEPCSAGPSPQQPAAREAATDAGQAAAVEGQQAEQAEEQDSPQDGGQASGGLTAAYRKLVGLIDEVITLDPLRIGSEPGTPAAAAASSVAGVAAVQVAGSAEETAQLLTPSSGARAGADEEAAVVEGAHAKPAADGSGSCSSGEATAVAGVGGKPPKHPAPATAPLAVPVVSRGGKKKGKKKKKGQAASCGGGSLGQAGAAEQEESDSMADTSASDSGLSSLASSPGMARPLARGLRCRAGLAGGYQSSDWGSTVDLATKEGSVGVGSHLDGWSDAEDLFPMVSGQLGSEGASAEAEAGGSSAGVARTAAADGMEGLAEGCLGLGGSSADEGSLTSCQGVDASPATWAGAGGGGASALTAAALGAQQVAAPAGARRGALSESVQTCNAAVGADEPGPLAGVLSQGDGAQLADLEDGGWEESDSPHGFVIPGKPSLFDEGTAEYERVPRQRDCSTQTPPAHLLPAARGAGGRCSGNSAQGGGVAGGGHGAGLGTGSACDVHAVVTSDSRLEDVEAVFGHQGGPALHNLPGASQFGPSYLCAYRGVVFEVLENGLIATVTLFKA